MVYTPADSSQLLSWYCSAYRAWHSFHHNHYITLATAFFGEMNNIFQQCGLQCNKDIFKLRLNLEIEITVNFKGKSASISKLKHETSEEPHVCFFLDLYIGFVFLPMVFTECVTFPKLNSLSIFPASFAYKAFYENVTLVEDGK